MARPKKSEARDTRRDILDAALDLFARKGFYETSTRDIARQVGVRESALYHYFVNKAAILHGLLDELGPGRAAQIDSVDVVAVARAMGVRAMFKNIVHMLLTEWAAPREMKLTRLMITEGYRLKSEGVISPWQHAQRVRGIVAGVFDKLGKAKLIRKVDPNVAAISFMGPLMALRLLHLGMAESPPNLELLLQEVDGHLDFFCDNIELLNGRSAASSRKGA